MFVEGDGRGPWARRRRDLEALYADDLGGSLLLTEFQLSLVATAATLRPELEQMEGRMSCGETVDIDVYARDPDTSDASVRRLALSGAGLT